MFIKYFLISVLLFTYSFAQEEFLHLNTLTKHNKPINSIAFSPDGKYLASGSDDKTIIIWDALSGREIKTLTGHTDFVLSVVFSPDGKYLASGSSDKTIKIWEISTWSELRTLKAHTNYIKSLSFSPDGKYLASGSEDKTIKLWDIITGDVLKTLIGHKNSISTLSFSTSGEYLASGSYDNTIRLWDVLDGKEIKILEGHTGYVWSIQFSPDGEYLASVSLNFSNTIKLWDVASNTLNKSISGTNSFSTITFSPDSRYLISGDRLNDGFIRVWDVSTSDSIYKIKGHPGGVLSVVFSPDCQTVASCGADNKIKLWLFSVYHKEYENIIESRYPELFKPKDEFETTSEYAERKKKAVSVKNALIVELIQEELQKTNLERIQKEKDKRETIEKSKELISIKIENVGSYNADQETFPIRINFKTEIIKIPRTSAREFKENWQKAKVTGWKQLTNDLKTYEYYNIIIQHPITGVEYPFGEQRGADKQQQLTESNSKTILPSNLSLNLSFADANGNKFLDAKENGKIYLSIVNSGQGTAFGVKFDLQIDSVDYNLTYPKTIFVGEILPNSTKQIDIDISASKTVQRKTHTLILKGYESNGFNPPESRISFETFPLVLPEFKLADYGITSNRGDNIIRAGEISNLKIRFQNVGQGLAQNASIVVKLPSNVFFTPDSKKSENYENIGQGEFVDIDISVVPNNMVSNEVQINFLIKEENTEVNLPLKLPINKQLASIQELVIKGEENKINIQSVALISSEIEKDIPLNPNKRDNTVALVIGISEYQNSNVPKVVYAKRDASLIRQYLEKSFAYDTKNILPRNEDEIMTSGTIKNYIKNVIPTYLKQDGSSELFIYFTGHGAPSTKTRNAYFVPYDCDPNYVSDINAYNMNEFYNDISKLNAQKKIVVIDACFSGQSGDGNMLIKDASPIYVTMENEMSLDDKSIMFLSSGADQVSNWYPEKNHSMFTYFFLKGLQGNADLNKDGIISVTELENYINDENNGLPYYSNREFQRPQKAVIIGNKENPVVQILK